MSKEYMVYFDGIEPFTIWAASMKNALIVGVGEVMHKLRVSDSDMYCSIKVRRLYDKSSTIGDTDLSVRTYNLITSYLYHKGFHNRYILKFMHYPVIDVSDFAKFRGVGDKSLYEFIEWALCCRINLKNLDKNKYL